MVEEGRGAAPPHAILLLVVVGVVVAGPYLLGDGGEAVTAAFADALSPAGMLLLPVALVLLIRFLSSDRGSALSSLFSAAGAGSPDSIHRVGGSPVGVAVLLVILVLLLYYKISLFGGDDGDD